MAIIGSFVNRLLGRTRRATEPKVGDGATVLLYSDRWAGTIVQVVRFRAGKRAGEIRELVWQKDLAYPTAAGVRYERDPDGIIRVFTRRSDGRYVQKGETGTVLVLGVREEYRDPSF